MDDQEQKTLRLVIASIAALAATAILTGGGCTAHRDYRIHDEVVHGIDPIAAGCAHSANGSEPMCVERATINQ